MLECLTQCSYTNHHKHEDNLIVWLWDQIHIREIIDGKRLDKSLWHCNIEFYVFPNEWKIKLTNESETKLCISAFQYVNQQNKMNRYPLFVSVTVYWYGAFVYPDPVMLNGIQYPIKMANLVVPKLSKIVFNMFKKWRINKCYNFDARYMKAFRTGFGVFYSWCTLYPKKAQALSYLVPSAFSLHYICTSLNAVRQPK